MGTAMAVRRKTARDSPWSVARDRVIRQARPDEPEEARLVRVLGQRMWDQLQRGEPMLIALDEFPVLDRILSRSALLDSLGGTLDQLQARFDAGKAALKQTKDPAQAIRAMGLRGTPGKATRERAIPLQAAMNLYLDAHKRGMTWHEVEHGPVTSGAAKRRRRESVKRLAIAILAIAHPFKNQRAAQEWLGSEGRRLRRWLKEHPARRDQAFEERAHREGIEAMLPALEPVRPVRRRRTRRTGRRISA
jgi:hypothetical protein